MMKLCADAGGSKVKLAMVDEQYRVRRSASYNVTDLPKREAGLIAALSHYVKTISGGTDLKEIKYLVVGAAGPVENNRVQFTNSDWLIEQNFLTKEFSKLIPGQFKIALLNDFEALAYGLALLSDEDVLAINRGNPKGETRLVCGPGTGLGLAALRSLSSNRNDVIALSTEGGHQSFAAETPLEREICDYIAQPVVSYEQILSGRGLQSLYDFFSARPRKPNISAPLPLDIVRQYTDGDKIAQRTLETFASILGAFCGNMMLALGARKGVYLWGGILHEFPEQLLRQNMLTRLQQRPNASYVADAPVFKIISDDVAVKGCALYADKHG
jgi:glucokinase